MSFPLQVVFVVHGMSVPSLQDWTTVTSRAECVSLCYRDLTCNSIFYDTSVKTCHTSDTRYTQSELITVSPNIYYIALTTDGCANGYAWDREVRVCYILHHSDLVSWYSAHDQCAQEGGRLMVADTEANMDLTYRLAEGRDTLWLGGYRLQANQPWRWLNDVTIDETMSFWAVNENCMFMTRAQIYAPGLHDAQCDSRDDFICEIPLLPQQPVC